MHYPQPGITVPFSSCFPNQLFVCFPLLDFDALVEAGNCYQKKKKGSFCKKFGSKLSEGEHFDCLFCLLQASFEQSVQIGLQVTTSRCLQCTFEVSERKLDRLGILSHTGVSWGAHPWDSQPYVRERLCWLPSSGKAGLCLLPLLWGAQQSASSGSVFWHLTAVFGMERVEEQQAPRPCLRLLFLLAQITEGRKI